MTCKVTTSLKCTTKRSSSAVFHKSLNTLRLKIKASLKKPLKSKSKLWQSDKRFLPEIKASSNSLVRLELLPLLTNNWNVRSKTLDNVSVSNTNYDKSTSKQSTRLVEPFRRLSTSATLRVPELVFLRARDRVWLKEQVNWTIVSIPEFNRLRRLIRRSIRPKQTFLNLNQWFTDST